MRVFITGITGFIGSHLAVTLAKENHTVFGLARQIDPANEELASLIASGQVNVMQGDCMDVDINTLPKVDVIYHLAGKVSVWGSQAEFDEVNLGCASNMLSYAKLIGVMRFVYISTAAVYGYGGYKALTEDAPKTPFNSPYPISKLRTEEAVQNFCWLNAIEYTIVRPGNVYGPYDYTSYPVYENVSKNKMPVTAHGKYLSCFVYVENLVAAIAKAGVAPDAKNTDFNITDGNNETLNEYLTCVATHMGAKPKFASIPAWLAITAAYIVEGTYKLFRIKKAPLITRFTVYQNIRDYNFSIEKARKLLGYSPTVSMDEGVRRTCQWFKTQEQKGKLI